MRTLVAIALVACGGGKPTPTTKAGLEVFAELQQGPGNIAVTADNRVFVSQHQFYNPPHTVVEVTGNTTTPFAEGAVDSVLGLRPDGHLVWLLDNGMRNKTQRKLVAWDTRAGKVERTIDLMGASPDDAFLNDLAIDRAHDAIYIADPAGGKNAALIVVDLKTNTARRVLEGHASVTPTEIDLVIDGKPVQIKLPDGNVIRPHVGVNPIAVHGDWLYFGPMHATKLYRVRTAELRDPSAAPNVEDYATRPITDGIIIDAAGNIFFGDLTNNSIAVIGVDRMQRRRFHDPMLSWVDAFSAAPDGYFYVIANQLHRSAVLNAGTDATQRPFRILRFKP